MKRLRVNRPLQSVVVLWGCLRGVTIAPGHNRPPEDPMKSLKERKKSEKEGAEHKERVRRVFIEMVPLKL